MWDHILLAIPACKRLDLDMSTLDVHNTDQAIERGDDGRTGEDNFPVKPGKVLGE
jgi:hypothetical protein